MVFYKCSRIRKLKKISFSFNLLLLLMLNHVKESIFLCKGHVCNFFNSKVMNFNIISTCNTSNYIKSKLNFWLWLLNDQNKNAQHPLKPLRIPTRLLSFMNKAFLIQVSCSVTKVSQVICKSEGISIDKEKVISCEKVDHWLLLKTLFKQTLNQGNTKHKLIHVNCSSDTCIIF